MRERDDAFLKEVEWPVSARSSNFQQQCSSSRSARTSKTPSEGARSSCVTPQRRERSGRTSVSSSIAVEQSYDEYVRMQNVDRFMLAERERGVRTHILREEHDRWLECVQQEREERLTLCGLPNSRPTTPLRGSEVLSFFHDGWSPSPAPATRSRSSDASPTVWDSSLSRAPVDGEDEMPVDWRNRFRSIYFHPPTPPRTVKEPKPLEARCCASQ